jgi:pSer/pThr/pTyr-binding forkhead associated (FHA) protein
MASVTVVMGSRTIQEVLLKKDCVFIGRHDEAEICLDNPLVSRRHAMMSKSGGVWVVEDLSGKNGVFVNGKQVARQNLTNGDVIEIAKYSLTFRQSEAEFERDRDVLMNKPGAAYRKSYEEILGEVTMRKPKVDAPAAVSEVDITKETMALPPEEIAAMRKEMGRRRRPHLMALTQMERKVIPLDKKCTSLGKSVKADVRLVSSLTMKDVQANLIEEHGVYYLETAGGLTSVKLNGVKVTEGRHRLKDGDELEIGPNRLKFMAGAAS